jgi:hypothetical protein
VTYRTVPDGALFLTMTVVQRGKSLEVDVWGHGKGYRAYAVDRWDVKGAVDNPYAGAWEKLYRHIKATDGTWKNGADEPFRAQIVGIAGNDAADGRSEVVYRFAERWSPLAFPIAEFAGLLSRRGERGDGTGFIKYRMAKIGPCGEDTLEISGGHYGNRAESLLKIPAGSPGAVETRGLSARNLGLHLALADVWLDKQVEISGRPQSGGHRNAANGPGAVLDYMERLQGNYAKAAPKEGPPAWFKEAERRADFSVFIGPEDVAEISWGPVKAQGINRARIHGPCNILSVQVKRRYQMPEFNLKSVVDFLELSGFRVREAREEYAGRISLCHAIGVEISPKDPAAEFTLQSVLRFFDGNGFAVMSAREIEKNEPIDPLSVSASVCVAASGKEKPERALEAVYAVIREKA